MFLIERENHVAISHLMHILLQHPREWNVNKNFIFIATVKVKILVAFQLFSFICYMWKITAIFLALLRARALEPSNLQLREEKENTNSQTRAICVFRVIVVAKKRSEWTHFLPPPRLCVCVCVWLSIGVLWNAVFCRTRESDYLHQKMDIKESHSKLS